MKRSLVFMFAALIGGSVHAASWEKILQCDGAQVDVNSSERRELQLVVTDHHALKYLHDRGVVSLPFLATEIVLRGDTRSKMDFQASTGPKLRYLAGQGVFYPHAFDYFINRDGIGSASIYHYSYYSDKTSVGRLVTVYRKGSNLNLQYASLKAKGCATPTVKRTDCAGEGGGYCPRTVCESEEYTEFSVPLEYTFRNCR